MITKRISLTLATVGSQQHIVLVTTVRVLGAPIYVSEQYAGVHYGFPPPHTDPGGPNAAPQVQMPTAAGAH